MRSRKNVVGSVLFVLIILCMTRQVFGTSLFTEDFESAAPDWVLESPWAVTDEDAHGGTYCLTDSPGAEYENGVNKRATVEINLSGSNRPLLSFWHRYNLQQDKDYGYVQVSANDGATWETRFFISSDSAAQWSKDEIDLSPWTGTQILLRFGVFTDGSGTADGWYIDDLDVSDNDATTAFPFFDDMETSASDDNWIASSWRRIDTDGHDSTSCWNRPWKNAYDSPAFTLRGTMDFSMVWNPQLSFWHHKGYGNGDVYVSSDAGDNWDRVYRNAGTWVDWQRSQVNLSAYSGLSDIVVAFVLDSNGPWHIDDVLISDAPEAVGLPFIPPGDITEHSITLNWSQSPDSDFAYYRVYRSYYEDMRDRVELATITEQETTTYTDSDLIYAGTWYYYQVYVVDTEGLWGESSNIRGAKTVLGAVVHSLPFTDGMEEDTWANDLPWGLTDVASHSGTYCWTDSPVGRYENNTSRSLQTILDLTGSNRPLLSFWHRYNLEENKDFGFVEVSTDGQKTWASRFFVTGYEGPTWFKEEIDLSVYAGTAELYVRFRIVSDASGNRDGWYIDDVEVSENSATIAFPFFDDMETATSDDNWIASAWQRIPTDGHESSYCWSRPHRNAYDYPGLVLRGTMDFSWVTNPQLSFWHHKGYGNGDVYVSSDGGHTWDRVYRNASTWVDWQKTEVDLSAYSGLSDIAIQFALDSNGPWLIDDVEITGEWTGAPELQIAVEDGAGTLSWTPFGTGSYTVEWSEDLNVWTPETGMPITEASWLIGQIDSLGGWRFWRVSAPTE